MYVDGYMLLLIYIFAASALILALWMFLTLEDMKSNGEKWIKLNQDLLEKVQRLEKNGGSSPFYKK